MNTQATKVLGKAERSAIYVKMQQLWDKQANVVWVNFQTAFSAARAGIVPSLTPSGGYQPWNFRPGA
jgi:hypothetical protein